jgi:hypothetical protein
MALVPPSLVKITTKRHRNGHFAALLSLSLALNADLTQRYHQYQDLIAGIIAFFGCMHVTFRHVRCGTSADAPALRIVSTILRSRTCTRTLHDDLVIPPSPPIR